MFKRQVLLKISSLSFEKVNNLLYGLVQVIFRWFIRFDQFQSLCLTSLSLNFVAL